MKPQRKGSEARKERQCFQWTSVRRTLRQLEGLQPQRDIVRELRRMKRHCLRFQPGRGQCIKDREAVKVQGTAVEVQEKAVRDSERSRKGGERSVGKAVKGERKAVGVQGKAVHQLQGGGRPRVGRPARLQQQLDLSLDRPEPVKKGSERQ